MKQLRNLDGSLSKVYYEERKNRSTHSITKENGKMGGWVNNCSYYKITDVNGNDLALVNEKDGTVVFPQKPFGSSFVASKNNRVLRIGLDYINEDSIDIMWYCDGELFTKKLYYYDK